MGHGKGYKEHKDTFVDTGDTVTMLLECHKYPKQNDGKLTFIISGSDGKQKFMTDTPLQATAVSCKAASFDLYLHLYISSLLTCWFTQTDAISFFAVNVGTRTVGYVKRVH